VRNIRFATIFTLSALSVFAQSTSVITGQVTDPSGAAVPKAKITVTAVETGVNIGGVTNSEGYYTIPSLRPARYSVAAESEGFRKTASEEFKLDPAETKRVDLTLQVAGAAQAIEVTAAPPAIESQTSMTGSTMTEQEIHNLPLDGRNTLELAMSLPAVAGEVGSDEGGIYQTVPSAGAGLSISGGRQASSAFLADGANATSVTLGRQTVTFSPDTIQEFRVLTSTFSAQYGVTGGGVVSTISKSGTNEFHGSAFFYQRNPTIAARRFNSQLPPQLRRNEGGVTFHGPAKVPKLYSGRNKTFFFFSLEPKRWTDGVDNYIRVLTAEERAGDFRNMWVRPGQARPLLYQQVQCADAQCSKLLPFNRATNTTVYRLFSANDPDPAKAGRVIPKQYLDPLVQKLLQDVPLPNMPYDSEGNNYAGVRGVKGRDNRWNLKIDHNLAGNNRLSVRYTHIPNFSERYLLKPGDYALASYPSDTSFTRQFFLSDTHVISPRVVNEFRGNYTFSDYSSIAPGELGKRNFTREFGLPSVTDWGYPRFSLSGTRFLTPSLGMGNNQLLGQYIEHQYQFSDDVTMTLGRHTITAGFDWRYLQSNVKAGGLGDACCGNYTFNSNLTASGNANIPTGAGGDSFASFLLGVPSSISLRGLVIPYYYRWKVGAAYFQDDFKMRPSLILNLGIRWQYNSPRAEKWNRQASIDLDSRVDLRDAAGRKIGETLNYVYSGLNGASRYLEPAHRNNFEPRFGFAWTPRFHWNRRSAMVVRGGYGISHAPVTGRGRDPLPDFGAGSGGSWNYVQWTGSSTQPVTQSQNPQYLIGVGRNAPAVIADPVILQIPQDGKLCAGCTPRDPRVPSGNLVAFLKNNQTPYIQTWNLTIQYLLRADLALTVSYLGQKGTHLYSPVFNLNNPDPKQYQALLEAGGDPLQSVPDPFGRVDASGNLRFVTLQDLMRPFPTLGDISVAGATNSNSIYNAGVLEVQRRFRGWYGFRFNYTWSKSIDNSSNGSTDAQAWTSGRFQNALDLASNRSVSFVDSRHRFNVTSNVQLPFGRRNGVSFGRIGNMLAGGWSVNLLAAYYSGAPFSPYLGDNNGIPGGNVRPQVIRPDIVPGVPLINPRWNRTVANDVPYINPEAFARPPFGRMGNAPRTMDYLRGPWTQTLNANLARDFRPFENRSRYLQFRAEFFNVLNHTYFQLNPNSSPQIFTGSLPLSRTGLSLAGPIPYLPGQAGAYPAGTREAALAQAYNSGFGLLPRANNSPARILQFAIRLYW